MPNPNEIKMSTTDVQDIKEALNEMQLQFRQFAKDQTSLITLVSGNELDKNDTGMIGRLEKVEKNQESFKKFYWMGMGGAVVVGFILQYIWQYLKH